MIVPIRCFTCGKVIADKYDYYMKEAEKLKLMRENPAHNPNQTKEEKLKAAQEMHDTRHFDTTRTGILLDSMGLTRYCCRRHMLSTVDMMEII
jgi:DNA-directed RNA polymerase subunit N (RpoN/RPB10)